MLAPTVARFLCQAVYFAREPQSERGRKLLLVGGGVVFPVVTLGVVLGYSLRMLPELLEPAPEGSLRIEVVGYQWWWRVHYPSEDGQAPIALANEIRLPAGERTVPPESGLRVLASRKGGRPDHPTPLLMPFPWLAPPPSDGRWVIS